MSEAIKDDKQKAPMHLMPLDAIEEVAKVLDFGARKYAPRNWEKGLEWHRIWGALLRHAFAWWKGEDNDPETGLSHMAHCACCALFLMAYVKRGIGQDDRPGKANGQG